MSKKEVQKRSAIGDIQSVKVTIQSLAHELWVEKRNTMKGVDWLVDGRLMAQLNKLSEAQLLRVERLLGKLVKGLSTERYMTTGSV